MWIKVWTSEFMSIIGWWLADWAKLINASKKLYAYVIKCLKVGQVGPNCEFTQLIIKF